MEKVIMRIMRFGEEISQLKFRDESKPLTKRFFLEGFKDKFDSVASSCLANCLLIYVSSISSELNTRKAAVYDAEASLHQTPGRSEQT